MKFAKHSKSSESTEYVTELGRVCLSEVRECWLLLYSSNSSKSAYNFYTCT